MLGLRGGSILPLSLDALMKVRLLIFFIRRVWVHVVRRKGDTWDEILHLLNEHAVGREARSVRRRARAGSVSRQCAMISQLGMRTGIPKDKLAHSASACSLSRFALACSSSLASVALSLQMHPGASMVSAGWCTPQLVSNA